MNAQGSKAILVAMIVTIGVVSAAFVYFNNSSNPITTGSSVESIWICGNTSDIIFPELMEASIVQDALGSWQVSASFLDDSEGWEYPEPYDRTFSISSEDVSAINNALLAGLNQTHQSVEKTLEDFEPFPHIGFEIKIIYTDGAWIYVCTFQTEEGHFMVKSGSGNPDTCLDAPLMKPIEVLDGLVTTVQAVFSSNIV